jgi:hypothetical protein
MLRCAQIDPGNVRTLCALATLERRAGHHKAARVHLRHALQLQPSNPAALQVGPCRTCCAHDPSTVCADVPRASQVGSAAHGG